MTQPQPDRVDDLYELALARFDNLLSQGKLLYEPSQPEKLQHNGFTVSNPTHLRLRHENNN